MIESQTPKKRPSFTSTPSRGRVESFLHKVSLQFMLGRVAASDPALGILDLTNNVQFLGLTSQQKQRAINVLAMGDGLHTLKLNSLGLDNAHAPAIQRLLRSRHMLQAFSVEGNNLTESGIIDIGTALSHHKTMQEVCATQQRSRVRMCVCARARACIHGL